MITNNHLIDTKDQQQFNVQEFLVDENAAVIHILHGMAEHCDRYREFAQKMNHAGFSVWLHNHRGHGERSPLGHLDTNEWDLILDDAARLHQQLANNREIIVFAHSMGSFIARDLLSQNLISPKAVILSGSNAENPAIFKVGFYLATVIGMIKPSNQASKLLTTLSFGRFNKRIKNPKTAFDWLSRNTESVQAYIDDPKCGFACTTGFWREFFKALIRINSPKSISSFPKSPALLLLSGDQDPVGHYGEGVKKLEQWLSQEGVNNISTKLYPGGRHEMLHETVDVFPDIIDWLHQQT